MFPPSTRVFRVSKTALPCRFLNRKWVVQYCSRNRETMRLLRKGTFMNCDFCEENFCDWAITAAQSRPNSHGLPVSFNVDRSQGKLTNLMIFQKLHKYNFIDRSLHFIKNPNITSIEFPAKYFSHPSGIPIHDEPYPMETPIRFGSRPWRCHF